MSKPKKPFKRPQPPSPFTIAAIVAVPILLVAYLVLSPIAERAEAERSAELSRKYAEEQRQQHDAALLTLVNADETQLKAWVNDCIVGIQKKAKEESVRFITDKDFDRVRAIAYGVGAGAMASAVLREAEELDAATLFLEELKQGQFLRTLPDFRVKVATGHSVVTGSNTDIGSFTCSFIPPGEVYVIASDRYTLPD